MTETDIKIPLSGTDKNIYGTLRGTYEKPLFVLCHGYGGWRHEMLLYNAARYFGNEGFSTLRLSMYGGGEHSRDIYESDVMTHSADIDDVVAFVKNAGAKWVGVVGHSYSGMAIVYSKKQQFNAAVLWDPTHTDGYDEPQNKKNLENDFIYVPEQKIYVSGIGNGYVYAKSVFENNYLTSQEASSEFHTNTLIINASWSEAQQSYGKKYAKDIKAETERIVIPDSTHPFTGDGIAEKLFAETSRYFKKSLRELASKN